MHAYFEKNHLAMVIEMPSLPFGKPSSIESRARLDSHPS
jgi:hypothetical protein